jgi:hypothetical protein
LAIPKLTDDLNIIATLGDNPNTDNNLTPEELKKKFDAAALIIQTFINTHLVPVVNKNTEDVGNKLPTTGGTMQGGLNMGGFALSGLPVPTADNQAATMKWVLDKIAEIVGFTGAHSDLSGRDALNQHPMSAIDGLLVALSGKAPVVHNHNANAINDGVLPIARGGTGGDTEEKARAALGITPENIGALASTGDAMSGALTLKGIVLTSGVDFGDTLPANPTVGRLFFLDEDAAAELGV